MYPESEDSDSDSKPSGFNASNHDRVREMFTITILKHMIQCDTKYL